MDRPRSRPLIPARATGAAAGIGRAAAGAAPAAGAAVEAGRAAALPVGVAERSRPGAAGGAGGAGAREAGAAAGAPAAEAGGGAVGGGGPPAGNVGNLMVGAEVGLGGKLMRTVSFLGCTLPVSAFLGGTPGAPGAGLGMFSAINSFSLGRRLEARSGSCQTLIGKSKGPEAPGFRPLRGIKVTAQACGWPRSPRSLRSR
jgi:hypothetical protein